MVHSLTLPSRSTRWLYQGALASIAATALLRGSVRAATSVARVHRTRASGARVRSVPSMAGVSPRPAHRMALNDRTAQ